MALEDIKKAILDEANKSVSAHQILGREKISEIKKEWDEKKAEKINKLIESAKRKMEKRIQQSQFVIQIEKQSEILKKKQEIISKVYKIALEKLSKLSDSEYVKMMEKLINDLPDSPGFLVSAENKNSLLKKALENSRKKHQISKDSIKSLGGFIYQTEKIEINQSFEVLIENDKQKSFTKIIKKIFG